MKKIFLLTIFLSVIQKGFSQNNDFELGLVVPRLVEPSNKLLFDKLAQMLTINGRAALPDQDPLNQEIGGATSDYCFILYPIISEISREVIPIAPPRHSVELSVTLFVATYDYNRNFATYNFNIKGLGATYERAYMNAIGKISPNDSKLQNFLVNTKEKITKYYSDNCNFLLSEAESIAQRTHINTENGYNTFLKAINILTQINKVNHKCYANAESRVQDIYDRYRKFACDYYLMLAKIEWTSKTSKGDSATFANLKKIPPSPHCVNELNAFLSQIQRQDPRASFIEKIRDSTSNAWKDKIINIQSQIIESNDLKEVGLSYRKNVANALVESTWQKQPAKKD